MAGGYEARYQIWGASDVDRHVPEVRPRGFLDGLVVSQNEHERSVRFEALHVVADDVEVVNDARDIRLVRLVQAGPLRGILACQRPVVDVTRLYRIPVVDGRGHRSPGYVARHELQLFVERSSAGTAAAYVVEHVLIGKASPAQPRPCVVEVLGVECLVKAIETSLRPEPRGSGHHVERA